MKPTTRWLLIALAGLALLVAPTLLRTYWLGYTTRSYVPAAQKAAVIAATPAPTVTPVAQNLPPAPPQNELNRGPVVVDLAHGARIARNSFQPLASALAARGLEVLQRENIRLLVTCEDPSLTARHITEAYHLPEGMITLLDQEQCSALTPAQPDETARCCMLHDKGFASLIGGLRAAEKAQNAETSATTVQMVSVWFSVVIGVLLTYAGSIGTLSVAAVLMYQAAWSALSIAVCALKQHN